MALLTDDLLLARVNDQTELFLAVAVTLVGILAIRGALHWFMERNREGRQKRSRARERRAEEEHLP